MDIKIGRFKGEATKDRCNGINLPIGQIYLLNYHHSRTWNYNIASCRFEQVVRFAARTSSAQMQRDMFEITTAKCSISYSVLANR